MKKIVVSLLTILSFSFVSNAQLTVSTGSPAATYVTNNLIGPGVTVSNVTFSGNASQIGSFNGAASNIGFPGGIVMAAGAVSELQGVGSGTTAGTGIAGPGDASLLAVATAPEVVAVNPAASGITETNDAAILEFDFVAQSNVVSFNFVFGSDEYLTYVNSQFNDVFGFFVSGPGITGPYTSPAGFPGGAVNLALVPGTNLPITISTIHPGLNASYYVDNQSGTTHTLNGQTVPIGITFDVICGETYHFKFAVADCQDDFLSTAVFLQDDSFTSPPVELSLQTANGTDTIPEACVDANILFIRSACQSTDSLQVDFTVAGTATAGVDFNLAASPIFLLPGQDTASINVAPIVDALPEGTETIVITVTYLDANGNPQQSSGILYIEDITPFTVNAPPVTVQCFNDSIPISVTASGGSGVYTYDWASSTSVTNSDVVGINANGVFNYIVTVTDLCLGPIVDTVQVTMNQTISIDSIQIYPASACLSDGAVSSFVSGIVGVPQFNWNGNGENADATVLPNIASGWYYFTVSDNVCSAQDSAFVPQENPPIAAMTPSITSGCSPLSVTFSNSSQNTNSYTWLFGDGTSQNTTDLTSVNHSFADDAIVTLIAFNGSCSDTVTAPISVSICGCMDPEATNYNPLAEVSDGSCSYPFPEAEAPNVVTPNSDGVNDYFELTVKNTVEIEIIINNRWGNKVWEGKGPAIKWDAKGVEEGVYFYQYIARGVDGTEVNGHGFVQVFK